MSFFGINRMEKQRGRIVYKMFLHSGDVLTQVSFFYEKSTVCILSEENVYILSSTILMVFWTQSSD